MLSSPPPLPVNKLKSPMTIIDWARRATLGGCTQHKFIGGESGVAWRNRSGRAENSVMISAITIRPGLRPWEQCHCAAACIIWFFLPGVTVTSSRPWPIYKLQPRQPWHPFAVSSPRLHRVPLSRPHIAQRPPYDRPRPPSDFFDRSQFAMAIFSHDRHHWAYVWIPIFGAFIWFGTLWSMIITWLASGQPLYVSEEAGQHVAYISDVGADFLKPLFVTACCITGVCFFLSLVTERLLRHTGRLLANMRRREMILSCLAIVGSFIGGAGLILLSVFDTKRHPTLHRVFLLVFIVGVSLSAVFTIAEYRWLSKDFVEVRKLRHAYMMKGAIAITLILLAIVFAITLYTAKNVGAVIEWVIAFCYTFYLLTFYFDLRMSKGVHRGELRREVLMAQRNGGGSLTSTAGGRASADTYPSAGAGPSIV